MSSAMPAEISRDMLERFAELSPAVDQVEPETPWWDSFGSDEYAAALSTAAQGVDETLSLYIHVPFCPGRCLYCGCNTTITHDSSRIDRYLDVLDREMALVTERLPGERDVLSLHLAGGTPNYLNDAQLTRLTEMVERRFRLLPDTDLSIECDPRRTSAGQLDLLYALGYQRITFGVQDLDPGVQRAIGRIQSLDLIRDVYWTAREIGFDSIGFDLIFGLPHQTEATFQRTLETVAELQPDRVACFGYSRSTTRGSHQHAIDVHQLPSALERQVLFHNAVKVFTAAGYAWLGLDNFALDTDELAVAQQEGRLHRSCIGYTARVSDLFLGFGAGAVGEVGGYCVQNQTSVARWQEQLEQDRFPVGRGHCLNSTEQCRRQAIEHLICNLELPASMAAGCLEEEYKRLASFAPDGLVEIGDDRLRITTAGRFFLRNLCSEHDAYFNWDRARWHFARSS
ncbi:oxygen-independent coproporphyrinogen III oxidase [Thiohalocapsa marina]|uniref:Coproporphyrinogen-III oxidase n=1 Tax=Thiohalocapsa marina TaxID=424902 RepID=A0A5M8FI98_9GAMM|nr:oxygen-independent coproporphyrinogen III oxidase [Thiohalocapsa marina]KAA6182841.1 oxygen-independent coproporphyrinogen III oxidase [Thiohalocapsa marina]